ncbi:uncharacterized protein LOC129764715 [Toxorhynchites rutilus septentrionalis]|uniref:uncharacterized protein LOC129764715 n=1 Tax=Toxorhynchites rutilus septentrionalis TaxID=329112 RepID=UPI00247AF62C|nr:uncharacterized protein LOC129764715 [Toxorhynchites rutilus septentrionalis]
MVACDDCETWFHFACVNESPGVEHRDFRCSECAAKREKKGKKSGSKSATGTVPKPLPQFVALDNRPPTGKMTTSTTRTIISEPRRRVRNSAIQGGDDKSLVSRVSKRSAVMELEMRRMEEELAMKEKQLEAEKLIRERRLEIEQLIAQKRFQQEKELQERRLAQEKEMLEKQLAEEIEFQRKQRTLQEKYQRDRHQLVLEEIGSDDGAVGGQYLGDFSEHDNREKVHDWLIHHVNPDTKLAVLNENVDEVLKVYEDQTPKRNPEVPRQPRHIAPLQYQQVNRQFRKQESVRDESRRNEEVLSTSTTSSRDGSGPTRAQRAARQILTKKLPTFTGRIEEWPLFYSSYINSTDACGFSNIENLVRLQECLKGPALESVRSRLLLPNSVPEVIKTLRMLYGRPEQLIHALLNKVRKADAPRSDRLETFIPFGMAVQELCDHLEAANLQDHLVNPILIQELVEKLPAATKREWVQCRRLTDRVTLRTFADFTSSIVAEATEVILVVDPKGTASAKGDKPRSREKGFVQAHSDPSSPAMKHQLVCQVCKKDGHRVRNCDVFRSMTGAERLKWKEQYKLCERCLNEHEGWCKFKITCNVGNCREHHHPLVHRNAIANSTPRHTAPPTTEQHHAHITEQRSVIFRIIPIILYYNQRSVKTSAYLDEGSSMTLIEESLFDELKASGEPQPLTLQWTGNIVRRELGSVCLSLQVSGDTMEQRLALNEARTVKKLYLPRQRVNFREIIGQYPHLQGLYSANQAGEEPKILIGLNNIHLMAPLESRIGNINEPIAVRSLLGWTIYGPRGASHIEGFLGCHRELTNKELHDVMREYFVVEEAGVTVNELSESDEVRRARDLLKRTTVRVECRFETGLLFKHDDFELPDSYPMALKRLCGLERRLKKDPSLEQAVCRKIEEYQTKQYAHKLTDEEMVSVNPKKIWYLPLGVVVNPNKPGKIRLVLDAAAQVNGTSLNSLLLSGPDLLTSLPAIIQQFRERPVAFKADIREMFHQYRIREADKHVLRFLFRTDPSCKPDVYVMDVGTFGAACSPTSAQYVKNLNASQHADQFPDAARAIVRRHYVDDYLDSADTAEEAINRAKQVRYVHSKAGFELHSWVSNERSFTRALGGQETEDRVPLQLNDDGATERVLGIIWCPHEDVFTFSTNFRKELLPYLINDQRPTKRIALRCLMSLFDPLGFLSPFTIHGKIVLQSLWRTDCDWDQKIDDESYTRWSQWISKLPMIEEVKIPRCYLQGASPKVYEDLQLHVFVDASEQAYGAAAFFRITTDDGPRCSLVMARTKVAPLKLMSIPRMELMGAVLRARLLSSVEGNHELKVMKRTLWTDSQNVFSWIRSDQRKYKPFVAFRIGEILQETKIDEWRWVPTKYNVADMLTKWGKGPCLDSDGPWFAGPQFLQQSEEMWPIQKTPAPNTKTELRACHMLHTSKANKPIIDVSRFSRWNVLLRTICCVYRFLSNCRRRVDRTPIEVIPDATKRMRKLVIRDVNYTIVPLKQEEYELAEVLLWKTAQREMFACEVAITQKNRQLTSENWIPIEKNSAIYHCKPFLDECDVLRMDGRTKYADFIPYDTRFPIILPRDHEITDLLLAEYHRRYGHANRETTFNEIRQRYYIPKLRSGVKRAMKNCQWCRVKKSRPQVPTIAPLPVERLMPFLRPFSYVGVDYFGPIEVALGRRVEKRWVVLFTCLTIRAVHLEIAHKLNTDSCIMAIRRFVLRRGPPIIIFSDNGTNLKAANKELQEQIRRIGTGCANVFTNAKTRWCFNPPSAPHMGGIWERMVRTVKTTMATLNTNRRMNDETLLTVIAEAEEIVNCRPLVYMPQESTDAEALTPNHYLRGTVTELKDPCFAPTRQAEALRSTYQRSQYIADELWKRWLKEYVPSMNVHTKWLEDSKPLKVGDLVFITDDQNRNGWVRGRVDKVIAGKDGRVRQAEVHTSGGLFRRPVAKLAVIEIGSSGKSDQEAGSGRGLRVGEMLKPLGTETQVAKLTSSE